MKQKLKNRTALKVESKRRMASAGAFCLILCLFFLSACGGRSAAPSRPEVRPRPPVAKKLANMGFTIQAGAFSRVENAARMTDALRLQGLDAYYFVSSSGLFKVRFGNFSTKNAARQRAEALRTAGVIAEFYIVSPEEYAAARRTTLGDDYLREQLIKTAKEFIGVPYLWGGTTPENGFDCSGLVMAVYQLNGLALPRTSRDQFEAGMSVDRDQTQKGDLVFFANGKNDPISHVGIYIGNGRFIHAPGRGKTIRIDFLSSRFYINRYMGSRTYL
ncbi:Cell wall-associated hydrolase, NlpC family [Syntrophus gentianae]|uniref:Cell wall-associated hydrolase, NlpC family n=1 Tax=Syntrophus gentianae TaxID=43775 RepID=A0A1H7XLP3_9BACT|nr:NlpC/P60 family protein [Syntrophus gentianae]SEM34832.1 Cell wall-associated hydrolase, NlpC family [Syntrophus gentianae]